MGQKINYMKNNNTEPLNKILYAYYVPFKSWYLNSSDYDTLEPDVLNYLLKNNTLDKISKSEADQLAVEFVGLYCEINRLFFEDYSPSMNKWRYKGSTEMVKETNNVDFKRLWDYLVFGRSVYDSGNIYNEDGAVGYLAKTEYNQLKQYIYDYFGNAEVIKNKYWTIDEKRRYDEMLQKGENGISNHNPVSEGLEIVLQATESIDCFELITFIE